MKKDIYFSIRTVKATNTKNAIEVVKEGNFEEWHPLCDKILTQQELITELQSKIEYVVLTNERGDIIGVIGYENPKQLQEKTFSLIETSIGDGIKSYIGEIIINQSFSIQFNNEPSEEFYLTPTYII